jgi:mRNA interferase MazF
MAERMRRGDIWLYTFSRPDKRRPVLVLSRSEVIDLLHTVIVAPITTTVHGAPSEVIVGIDEGLKQQSAINLDHVQTVDKTKLKHFVGTVPPQKMNAVCSALAIATGCDTQERVR